MNRPLGVAAVPPSPRSRCRRPSRRTRASYTTSAKKFENGTLSDFTRYVVINHGRTVGADRVQRRRPLRCGVARLQQPPERAVPRRSGHAADPGQRRVRGRRRTPPATAAPRSWRTLPSSRHGRAGCTRPRRRSSRSSTTCPSRPRRPAWTTGPGRWTPALVAAGFDLADLATAAGAKAACEAEGGRLCPRRHADDDVRRALVGADRSAGARGRRAEGHERRPGDADRRPDERGRRPQDAGRGPAAGHHAAEARDLLGQGQERRQADRRRSAAEGRQR